MIKKYLQYIKEAEETDSSLIETPEKSETDESESSSFIEIRDELKSMIEESAEKQKKDYNILLKEILQNPKERKIDKLVKDADIFDFYEKWRNDIDEILNNIKFFDEPPSEKNARGLYKFLIVGTEKAIIEFLKMK